MSVITLHMPMSFIVWESGILYFSTQQNMRSWKHLNTILNDIPIISVIFVINKEDKCTLSPVTWNHKVTTATNPSLPGRNGRCQNDSPRCNQRRDGCQHDEPWPQYMLSDTFYKHTNLMQFSRIYFTYMRSVSENNFSVLALLVSWSWIEDLGTHCKDGKYCGNWHFLNL